MTKAISMHAAEIKAKEPERQAINDAINAPINGTKYPIVIQKIDFGRSALTEKHKRQEQNSKKAIKKRQRDGITQTLQGK